MRSITPSSAFALLFLLFTSIASAASILGIDYGTEFIKAALVKPGVPLEIVLTKDSKRKEVAAVAFKPRPKNGRPDMSLERLYGTDAVNFAARFPNDVYPNLKQLLGAYDIRDERVQTFANRFPSLKLALSSAPGRSTVEFKSEASATDGQFSLVELIAMQLVSIRKSGEALAADGNPITDCVISVPPFFTAEERHAIKTAAELAQMNVMELISDGLAVGLNYAMTRQYTVDMEPETHIVYDMGAGSTSATLFQVRAKTIKEGRLNKTITEVQALGVGFDRSLGGDAFNQKMVDLLLKEFEESKAGKKLVETEGKPIKELLTGKQVAKLWKEASRVRHILSANNEAVSSIESFFPDVDFRSRKIQRAEFEELCSEYIGRITKPIIDSVDKLKKGLEEVNSIIIFGGGVRAPFVQKVLSDLVGDKIVKNVNGDEAAVMGATFRGASLSKLFRVKDIRVLDVTSYNVGMTYTSEATGKEISQQLFAQPAWRGHTRFVPLKQTSDFSFNFYQILGHQLDPKAPKEQIFKVTTTNLTDSLAKLKNEVNCLDSTITTTLYVKVEEKFGLPEVVGIDIGCEYDEKKTGIVDDVKGFFGFGGKDKDQKVLKDESSSEEASESTKTKSKSKTKTTSAAPIPTGENGKPIEKINVAFTVERAGLKPFTKEEVDSAITKLRTFETDDKLRIEREEGRNNIEAYTYRCTELLTQDGFIAASTEEQREDLEDKVKDLAEWVYGYEANICDVEVLIGRYKELSALEAPITHRRNEAANRPDAISRLETNIKDGKSLVEKMKKAVAKHERDVTSWSSYSSSFVESVSKSEAAASASAEAEASKSSAEAEASASAAAEAGETESSATEEEASTETPAPSEAKDPLEDLDESADGSSSSSKTKKSTKTKKTTSKTKTKTKKPTPTPAPTVLYTLDDVKEIEAAIEESEKYLKAKTPEQEKLKPYEDPVILVKELTEFSQTLEGGIRRLSKRKGTAYTPPKPKPVKKSKKQEKESKERLEKIKSKLNWKDIAGAEGLESSLESMMDRMSDEELEQLFDKLTAESGAKGAKVGSEEDVTEEILGAKREEGGEEKPVEREEVKHDEL